VVNAVLLFNHVICESLMDGLGPFDWALFDAMVSDRNDSVLDVPFLHFFCLS
jgi:hypothetical protein